VPQQASATPLTKYDLFAPLHLATDNRLGASCAALTRLLCRAGKLMRGFRYSRPPLCAACPETALRAFFSKPAPPGVRFAKPCFRSGEDLQWEYHRRGHWGLEANCWEGGGIHLSISCETWTLRRSHMKRPIPAWSHPVSPRRANRQLRHFGALAERRQDRKGADLFRVRGAIRAHPSCGASSAL